MSAPEPPPSEHIILEGRLHPASILLQWLTVLRRLGLWIAIFIYQAVTADETFMRSAGIIGIAVTALIGVTGPVIHWLRYRYRLTSRELHIVSGFVRLKERRIPIDRIQDLSFESGVLHRLFRVVVVSVQTSSTQGAEAKLDAISLDTAAGLREALRVVTVGNADSGSAGTPAAGIPVSEPEQTPLVRVRPVDLALRGLTDNRAGAVLIGGLAILDRYSGVGDASIVSHVVDSVTEIAPALGRGSVGVATLVGLGVLAVWVAGWISSAVVNLLRFHGFQVVEREGVFHRTYGLLTHRVHALPRRRIQAVRVEQTLLRRLFGIAQMRTEDMGAGAHDKSAQRSGTDVFVPAAPMSVLLDVVERVLPGVRPETLPWTSVSPRVIRRTATRGLLLGAVVAAASFSLLGWPALFIPTVAWPLGALWGMATHRMLRWSADGSTFAVREGVLRRRHAFAPGARVQALMLKQTPFDRWHRVATLTAIVGGGSQLVVHNVPIDQARTAIEMLDR